MVVEVAKNRFKLHFVWRYPRLCNDIFAVAWRFVFLPLKITGKDEDS